MSSDNSSPASPQLLPLAQLNNALMQESTKASPPIFGASGPLLKQFDQSVSSVRGSEASTPRSVVGIGSTGASGIRSFAQVCPQCCILQSPDLITLKPR